MFLEAKVDQTELPLNDLLWLIITLGWAGGKDDFEIAPPSFTSLEDFKIMEKSTWKLLTGSEDSLIVSEYRLLLKPLSMGSKKEIPPATIKYRARNDKNNVQSLSTKLLQVDVLSPLKIPLTKLSIVGIIMSIFGLIFLIIFALTFIRKIYQKQQNQVQFFDNKPASSLAKKLPRNGASR